VNWVSSLPFFAIHAACLWAFFLPFHWWDVVACLGFYYLRMFGITAGYHRYFAHRTYKTSRAFQFVLALLGATSAQKGALWWGAHHRHHHKFSDQPEDIHSPTLRGFWWSHCGWILCRKYDETPMDRIKDFARYPELVWLNRYHLVPPILLGLTLFFVGGAELVVWGFFISTVLLWHGTFTINSLSHVFGKRRYKTTDTSRNNWLLAIVTMGEGWHNNHHYHQNTANQGWFWWEVDFSYYILKVLSFARIVTNLKTPSHAVMHAHESYTDEDRRLLAQGTPFRSLDLAEKFKEAAAEKVDKVKDAFAAAREGLPASGALPVKP
jgi:stearoyl-CoA desaturase (delta-9 desaturase)